MLLLNTTNELNYCLLTSFISFTQFHTMQTASRSPAARSCFSSFGARRLQWKTILWLRSDRCGLLLIEIGLSYTCSKQESLANARDTSDSSACVWSPLAKKSKLSRKPHARTKHDVVRQTGYDVMAIFCISKMAASRHLGFWKSKVAPLDRPTLKTPP